MSNLKIKRSRFVSVLAFAVIGLFTAAIHPYYISVTEVKYKSEEKAIQVSSKVFSDDIENALRKTYSVTVDVDAKKDSARVHKLLADYFEKHLNITVDGQKIKLDFLGFEKEEDVTWCYFEATEVKEFKKICVENTLLYDLQKEQINMLHFLSKAGRQSGKVTNPHAMLCFE